MKILLMILALLGCGTFEEESSSDAARVEQEGWSNNRKAQVRLGCEQSAYNSGASARFSVIYCDCVFNEVELRHSYDDFILNEIRHTNTLINDGTVDNCKNEANQGAFLHLGEEYYEDVTFDLIP